MSNDSPKRIWERKTMMDNSWGGVYGLAFLGALVYYIQHATTFWECLVGFFKAVFWPGVLMYKVLEYLKL
jgi:hypothetical protein